jgi:hypothetical protein
MAVGTVSQPDNPVSSSLPENPNSPVSTGSKLVVFLFILGFLLLGSMILGEVFLKLLF